MTPVVLFQEIAFFDDSSNSIGSLVARLTMDAPVVKMVSVAWC